MTTSRPYLKNEWGRVDHPYWDDSRLFIVGGGSSLRGFDFKRLQGRGRILCVNKAAFLMPCDCVFTLDINFHKNCFHDLYKLQGPEKYFALQPSPSHEMMVGGTYLIREHHTGFNPDPCKVNGTNSGFGALNLAIHKKAKEIYLLGFDFCFNGSMNHWHDGYRFSKPNQSVYKSWLQDFDLTKKQSKQLGVDIFNCSSISQLKTYPFRDIEDVLK